MKKFTLLPLVCVCLIVACKPTLSDQRTEDQTTAGNDSSHGFDELSSEYYTTTSRVIWQKPDLVLNLLGELKGKTVADIGAGTGFFAFRIANEGTHVIAIDIDPRAIEWMESEKSRYPVEVQSLLETRLTTPDNPGLKTKEVDLVLMVNTYIYIKDRVSYLATLRTGLKQNAQIIIIDFKDEETSIGPDLSERLAMSTVQTELLRAGYSITLMDSTSLQYQYILKAAL